MIDSHHGNYIFSRLQLLDYYKIFSSLFLIYKWMLCRNIRRFKFFIKMEILLNLSLSTFLYPVKKIDFLTQIFEPVRLWLQTINKGMYFIDKITWLFSAKIKLNS